VLLPPAELPVADKPSRSGASVSAKESLSTDLSPASDRIPNGVQARRTKLDNYLGFFAAKASRRANWSGFTLSNTA
jgi:hypothetical protein